MDKIDVDRLSKLRRQIFVTGYSGGMAHLASSFSSVEILYTLYLKGIMRYDPHNPEWPARDRFILSKGHGGLALYATLCMAGFFEKDVLATYLQPNTKLGGEPNLHDVPGIEASTGSLGHGLSFATGIALGQKIDGTNAKTFVLIGDGESQEGSVWEAAISATSLKLDNLIVIMDCNEIQKTDRVEKIVGQVNWKEKWEAFGWNVLEVDGHNVDALHDVLSCIECNERPTMVIAHTVKGKGVSIMENNPIWHYKMPNKKELKIFLQELEIDELELQRCKVHV